MEITDYNDQTSATYYNDESDIKAHGYASDAIMSQLDAMNLENMDPLSLVSWLGKLCLTTNHDSNKIATREAEFKKKTAIQLRFSIKECANTVGWLFCSAVSVAVNAGGLVWFGTTVMKDGSAAAGQSAITATQQMSTMLQPGTAYCQQRDEAAKTSMSSDQQVVNSDRDNQKQNLSAREQTMETMKGQLQQLLDKAAQVINAIWG